MNTIIPRGIIALLLSLLMASCAPLAYADDLGTFRDNEIISGDQITQYSPTGEEYVPPEQTTSPANVALISDDEKMAGCHYKAYKLMSVEFAQNGGAEMSKTLVYAPGVDAALIEPDNPTLPIQLLSSRTYTEADGNKDSEREYLLGLADRATASLAPVADLVVDTGAFTLPGTGYYLFVMDNYQAVADGDDHLVAPFFTAPVRGDEDIEILLKRDTSTDPLWLAKMIRGDGEPSQRAVLTAIYQPDNIPQDVLSAEEVAGDEEPASKADSGFPFAISLLPIALVIAGVIGLNVLMKMKKKKNAPMSKPENKQKVDKSYLGDDPAEKPLDDYKPKNDTSSPSEDKADEEEAPEASEGVMVVYGAGTGN